MLLERITIARLVGGVPFEFVTGILNSAGRLPVAFSFYEAHLYGAWVLIGAFVTHGALKLPAMLRSLRKRSLRAEFRKGVADTEPEPADEYGLVADRPDRPTISRRGALGLVAGRRSPTPIGRPGSTPGLGSAVLPAPAALAASGKLSAGVSRQSVQGGSPPCSSPSAARRYPIPGRLCPAARRPWTYRALIT